MYGFRGKFVVEALCPEYESLDVELRKHLLVLKTQALRHLPTLAAIGLGIGSHSPETKAIKLFSSQADTLLPTQHQIRGGKFDK